MKTDEEIVRECLSDLKKIIGLLKTELADINAKGNSTKEIEKNEIEELIRTAILSTQKEYLEFFIKISSFLCDKIKDDKTPDNDFYFYLPLLRTLIEIYATVLYLSFQSRKKQMTLIIINRLFSLANVQFKEKPSQEIEDEYKKYYLLCKPFIDMEKLEIPSDTKGMSRKWLNNSGYDYPHVTDRLSNSLIKLSSPQVDAISKSKTNPYIIYKYLSGYVHGNPLNIANHGNERFWVTGETLVCSAYLAETISTKILSGSKHKEIKNWITHANISYSNFVELWTLKSKIIYEKTT